MLKTLPGYESREFRARVAGSVEKVNESLAEAAGMWGAELERRSSGARLTLPVAAGLRRGLVHGDLSVRAMGSESEVVFRTERSVYHLQTTALVILLIAAAGGLFLIAWPFFPRAKEFGAVAPLGAVLALSGWFLVISRLRTQGPAEFLDLVAILTEAEDEPAETPDSPDRKVE